MIFKKKYFKYFLSPLKSFEMFFQYKFRLPFKKWLVNFIFQRIFRLNSEASFQVNFTSTIVAAEKIFIGRNVWVSFAVSGNCYIQAGNGIFLGDDTIFAPGVKIISANHDPKNKMKWEKSSPIKIGRRCWIGANAVILPGVELGDNCIVGAGAVVTASYPENSVVGGVPAKLITK